MTDDRARTPVRGVPGRLASRDTGDDLRSLERDVAVLSESISQRLERGIESFARLTQRVEIVERVADGASTVATIAAAPKPFPLWKILPVILTVLVLSGSIVTSLARIPGREELDAVREQAAIAHREDEAEIVALQKEAIALRLELRALRESLTEQASQIVKLSVARRK